MTEFKSRNRQPAGVPVGGQFADENGSSTGITLAAVEPRPDHLTDFLDPEEMARLDQVHAAMSKHARHAQLTASVQEWGFGNDDLAQEAYEDLARQVLKRGRETQAERQALRAEIAERTTAGDTAGAARAQAKLENILNGFLSERLGKTKVNGVATKAATVTAMGGSPFGWRQVNTASQSGMKVYYDRRDAMQLELGRLLTGIEEDALAQDIRDTWHDPKHKPMVGFHRHVMERASLSDTLAPPSVTNARVLSTRSAEESYFDSALDTEEVRAFDEASDLGLRRDANAERWGVFATVFSLPMADRGRLPSGRATKIRRLISGSDAAMTDAAVFSVIRRWEDGEKDESVEALFEALGATDEHDRQQFVDAIERSPSASEAVSMALSHATDRDISERRARIQQRRQSIEGASA